MSLDIKYNNNGKVTVLGMEFENDESRRRYFQNELRKKLPELRNREDFPAGSDEEIVLLSNPPYYTICPNPWITDINATSEREYNATPFAGDVSEGKTDPYYMVHSYHTKVPHRAIMRYLLHYTNPGDIVLDGFSGSGMTGVAATAMGDRTEIQNLGFSVDEYGNIFDKNVLINRIGERRAILSDLSPLASHISNNLNGPHDISLFVEYFQDVIMRYKMKYDYLYETIVEGIKRPVNYVVWSEVFLCPSCQNEIVFWDSAVDLSQKNVKSEFSCPTCGATTTKSKCERSKLAVFDNVLNREVIETKFVPVLINYKSGSVSNTKVPDDKDLQCIFEAHEKLTNQVPTSKVPEGDEISRVKNEGFNYVHQLIPDRVNLILSEILQEVRDGEYYNQSLFIITAALNNLNKLYRWRANGKGGVTSGTYYIPATFQENNVFNQLNRKLLDYSKVSFFKKKISNYISVNSATKLLSKDNSVDYIFTDPPFGANLMYSELNLIWETWIGIFTKKKDEAIVNRNQRKNILDYTKLMSECFSEYYRVLKPNHWITIEFSNSKASIWNAIQEAIQKSGFIIANVSALDKKQGSFKAVTTTTAVKQDLVISAYKPSEKQLSEMIKNRNHTESAFIFIDAHLRKLPVFVGNRNEVTFISERSPRILFDRMVAYHVQQGLPVPISSADFQAGVASRYPMRDGMAFLDSQVAEYDKKRILAKEFAQLSLFVSDENSAIEWIRQQLMKKPQSRQDIHPQFMKEIQHIAKYEELPELDELLAQNFLYYDGDEAVPNQISTYLTKNYHDLRGLERDDVILREKAKNRWYVPNPNQQADLEKLREKNLLREFGHYLDEMNNSKKKLKVFRTEAIRVGFKKAWTEKEYQTIVTVGERLPEKVIQEDDKLLMYYDNALMRTEM